MCACIEQYEQAAAEQYGVETKDVSFKEQLFAFSTTDVDTRTFSTLCVKVPSKKKPVELKVIHTHCPFCGVLTKKESEATA